MAKNPAFFNNLPELSFSECSFFQVELKYSAFNDLEQSRRSRHVASKFSFNLQFSGKDDESRISGATFGDKLGDTSTEKSPTTGEKTVDKVDRPKRNEAGTTWVLPQNFNDFQSVFFYILQEIMPLFNANVRFQQAIIKFNNQELRLSLPDMIGKGGYQTINTSASYLLLKLYYGDKVPKCLRLRHASENIDAIFSNPSRDSLKWLIDALLKGHEFKPNTNSSAWGGKALYFQMKLPTLDAPIKSIVHAGIMIRKIKKKRAVIFETSAADSLIDKLRTRIQQVKHDNTKKRLIFRLIESLQTSLAQHTAGELQLKNDELTLETLTKLLGQKPGFLSPAKEKAEEPSAPLVLSAPSNKKLSS